MIPYIEENLKSVKQRLEDYANAAPHGMVAGTLAKGLAEELRVLLGLNWDPQMYDRVLAVVQFLREALYLGPTEFVRLVREVEDILDEACRYL